MPALTDGVPVRSLSLAEAEIAAQPAPVVQPIPGRPSEPAPINADFRSDPATVVGATGNPQLIEFFTYW